jgi:putative photosynthetic complex assembly protein 2
MAPVLVAVLLWWTATGVILYFNLRPARSFPPSFAAASLLAALGLFGLWGSRGDTSTWGAYEAFGSALLVWGWLEMGFLMGFITGPRRIALPERARGFERFRLSVHAILWHELSLVASGAAILLLTLGGENSVGLWTFALLWVMRLSAKLNLFLGVRNPGLEFLPAHMRYLGSYFRQRALNPLLPVSLAVGGLATFALLDLALSPDALPGAATGHALLATLMALATLEHLLLALPLRTELLWRWFTVAAPGAVERKGTA